MSDKFPQNLLYTALFTAEYAEGAEKEAIIILKPQIDADAVPSASSAQALSVVEGLTQE